MARQTMSESDDLLFRVRITSFYAESGESLTTFEGPWAKISLARSARTRLTNEYEKYYRRPGYSRIHEIEACMPVWKVVE